MYSNYIIKDTLENNRNDTNSKQNDPNCMKNDTNDIKNVIK